MELKINPILQKWLKSLSKKDRKKLIEYDKEISKVYIDLFNSFKKYK